MAVNDGERVNALVTNSKLLSRLVDTDAAGKITLKNIDTTNIVDIQRALNDILTTIGAAHQAATDPAALDYSAEQNITDGDTHKEAIDKLDVALDVRSLKGSLFNFATDADYVTFKGFPASLGDIYYNTTINRPKIFNDNGWEELGGLVNAQREVPTGVIDGTNQTFTTSLIPLSDQHINIFLDGRNLTDAEVTISGSTLTLTTAPSVGQDLFVWYINEGTVAAPTAPSGSEIVEYPQLSAGDITAASITLTQTPALANNVRVDLIGASAQVFGSDYSVSGSTLDWSGLGLDGLVTAGDILRVTYLS